MLVMMMTAYNNCFPFKATNTCVLNHIAVFAHLKFLFLLLDLFIVCMCRWVGGWCCLGLQVGKEGIYVL